MYGTNTSYDTLSARDQRVVDYGMDRAGEAVQDLLNAHNEIMRLLVSDVAEWTTDRARRYGTADTMEMTATSEGGRPGAQKVAVGASTDFPLTSYQGTWQGTRKYFENASMTDLMNQVTAMRTADIRTVTSRIKFAIFSPINYAFEDDLVDHVPLAVKALLNADGLGIPVGPNGEVYDASTHTHYLGATVANTPATADFVALKETVLEHSNSGDGSIYISRSLETAIKAMTPNFTPLTDIRIDQPYTSLRVPTPGLNMASVNNRQIGYFDGMAVWVKPWMPTGYAFAFINGPNKPVVLRERRPGSGQLVLQADDERYPLKAETYEREFDAAIWNRTNGAVLDTTHTTYAIPATL